MPDLIYNNPNAPAGLPEFNVRAFLDEQARWAEEHAATLSDARFVSEPACAAAQLSWEGAIRRPDGELQRSLIVGVHAAAVACRRPGTIHKPDRLAWVDIVDSVGDADLTVGFALERHHVTGIVYRVREATGGHERDIKGRAFEELGLSPHFEGTLQTATDLHAELKTMRRIVTSGEPAGEIIRRFIDQLIVSKMPRQLFK
jgi:hypothetical protein